FCLEAARQLSNRTLILTNEGWDGLSLSDWNLMAKILNPEMVIVDDIDRVSDWALETKLAMFEEGRCNVPFVLLTSNDFTALPQAMRRPGRIDQIVNVSEPTREVLRSIVCLLAQAERVS